MAVCFVSAALLVEANGGHLQQTRSQFGSRLGMRLCAPEDDNTVRFGRVFVQMSDRPVFSSAQDCRNRGKLTPCRSNSDISLAKSNSDRLRRSTLYYDCG